ncbi:MAG: alpha/beta fold hydrolase [Methylacidiphilales bacterium]|nr:alpha/beta fold hydrolase [Candidatus Methylacidiphilales bacterium]
MTKLHLHDSVGTGPIRIILLHGLFGDGLNLRGLASLLQNASCYSLDLLNHGKSPLRENSSLEQYAQDIYETTMHLLPAVFIGHSLGAKYTMLFANQYPDSCQAVISLDMINRTYPLDFKKNIFQSLKLLGTPLPSRQIADDLLTPTIPDKKLRSFLIKNLTYQETIKAYTLRISLSALEHDHRQLVTELPINKIQVPSLYLMGSRGYKQNDDGRYLEKYHHNAEYQTIDNAGHWLHGDNPDQTAKQIQRFIDSSIITPKGR